MNKKISQTLDMVPYEQVKTSSIDKVNNRASKDIDRASDDDFDYARENLYSVIERGTEAMEEMLDVAKQSNHPRAFEVVSTIMKTLLDANKDLVEMSDNKKKQKQEENAPRQAEKIENNVHFHGTTEDLRKMVEELKNNDNRT